MCTLKSKCTWCTLLTYTYIQNENISENATVILQEGSASATDRRPIWCSIVSNWHSNITTISNNVAVDSKKAHTCAMQQFYREENLNKINIVFYFLRSVQRFCLCAAFIERLMLLFIIITRGKIACCEELTVKRCANIILFFLFTCCITIEYTEGIILVFLFK